MRFKDLKKSQIKHLVMLSGGLDSTALLATLFEQGVSVRDIYCIHFQFGSNQNSEELKAMHKVCNFFYIRHLDIIKFPLYFGSSLMIGENKKQITKTTSRKNMEQVIVPFRNTVLLGHAVNYALSYPLSGYVYLAAHKGDLKFPDCTPEYISSMKNVISIATERQIRLKAPFLKKLKRQAIKVLKLPDYVRVVEMTYSCYMGVPGGCGKCLACHNRKRALS